MRIRINELFGDYSRHWLVIGGSLLSAICFHLAFMRTSAVETPFLGGALLPMIIFGGTTLFAGVVSAYAMKMLHKSQEAGAQAQNTTGQLQHLLDMSDALVKSEPHVMVIWQDRTHPKLLSYAIDRYTGIPNDIEQLMAFRSWLDNASSIELEEAVADLCGFGQGFSLLLRTNVAHNLEVTGSIAAGLPVLRFRNVAVTARELTELFDERRRMRSKIDAHESLFDELPVSIWFRDRLGRLEWANKHYIQTVQAKNLDEVKTKQIELLELRQRKDISDHIADTGLFSSRVHTIVGGASRAYDTTIIPIDERRAGAAIDVGAIESAEGKLESLVAAHKRMLDQVSTAVAMFDTDQTMTFCNKAFLELWGFGEKWLQDNRTEDSLLDDLRGRRLLPEEADHRAWRAKHMIAYNQSEQVEDWWHLPDGRRIHVLSEQRPDGGVNRMFDDVSSQIDLESRYNALIGVQRETLDNLVEGVVVFASDGRMRLYNPAFARLWQLDEEFLETKPHVEEVITACRTLYDGVETWQDITQMITSIGHRSSPVTGVLERLNETYLTYGALPLPDGATLLTFSDISDSRRVENALIERNEALEETDNLKNTFLSHVSYELRTPLTNIIGFGDLLGGGHAGELAPKQQEYITDIQESSLTLLSIIDDILDLATIDAGNLDLNISQENLADVVEGAHHGLLDRIGEKDIDLKIHYMGDLPKVHVDRLRMTQVVYNLLSNAIGFSNPGSSVSINCWPEDDMVALSVADQGCGIREELIDHVFDRFEMSTQSGRHRGAGLGLSIVKSVVELHGGRVIIQSVPDVGTTVTVRFPIKPALAHIGEEQTSLPQVS